MNNSDLKRTHLKCLHIRKVLWDNILGEVTPIFFGKSAGLRASLQELYTAALRVSRKRDSCADAGL